MANWAKSRERARFFSITLCCALSLFSIESSASTPDVYWSGFAFQGDSAAGDTLYPISTKLSRGDDGTSFVFDDALRPLVAQVRNNSFNIVIATKGRLGPDAPSSIALAFVLDRETVSVEQFGNDYKILIELSAQALFFDFKESSVLASYPITLQYVHAMDVRPTAEDEQKIVESLYLGDLEINVFDEFVEALKVVELNLNVSRRIQVASVSIAEEVADQLPDFLRTHIADYKSMVAQEFSRSLSKNQDVPVLPFSKGYAISDRMATRFADGSVYTLRLPEPDYEINLELVKIVKLKYKEVPAGTSYVYGTYLQVKAEEPLSGRIYIDETIKNGAVKLVSAGQTTVDDWPAYQDSLSGLIEEFTTVLSDPNKTWAKKHIGASSDAKGLLNFSKVLMSCR